MLNHLMILQFIDTKIERKSVTEFQLKKKERRNKNERSHEPFV